jgi:hypothetical protein
VYKVSGLNSCGDLASTVFVLPFISAGDDMLFAVPQSPGALSTIALAGSVKTGVGRSAKPRTRGFEIEAQSNVREDFKMKFEVIPGTFRTDCDYLVGEVILTIEEILSRYSVRARDLISTNTSIPEGPHPPSSTTPDCIDTFDYLVPLFEFNRGSVRHKLLAPIPDDNYTTTDLLSVSMVPGHALVATGGMPLATYNGFIGGDGMAVSNPSQDADFTFEVPYYSANPGRRSFTNTQYVEQNDVSLPYELSTSTNTTAFNTSLQYVAAGSDFQLGNIWVLPNDAYLPTADS